MNIRPRRNRKNAAIRDMVQETHLGVEHLIYPVFLKDGKNIKEEIAQNRFREDLYHRLAVIEIQVPALNNRRDDIPLLADHFLSRLTPKKELLPDAVAALQKVDWTGNIRQLRNFIERLHILSGHQISAQDVSAYTLT